MAAKQQNKQQRRPTIDGIPLYYEPQPSTRTRIYTSWSKRPSITGGRLNLSQQLQTMFLLTNKTIISVPPKELKEHPLNISLFGELSKEDYQSLKKDIDERGIQDPLHITKNKIVISGHQRRKIALELDIECPCIIRYDLKEDWQIEEQLISDNLLRRHLKDWQIPPIAEKKLEIEKIKAKQRQKELAGTRPKTNTDLKENFPERNKGQARDKTAEVFSKSGRQLDKIMKVYNEAPEPIKKEWKEGKISTHKAYNKLKKEQQKQQIKEERKTSKPIPTGKFSVVYADPPWRYDFSETVERDIENQYPTMTVTELKNMNLPDVDDNSVLYLWATAPKLIEALEIMKSWGFQYKTHAIWDKEKIGMGYWFRGQHELLLVGTKGSFSPPVDNERVSSIFRYKRGAHSKKPDEIRDLITKWYRNYNKIELFARMKPEGWEVWGNE